MKPNNSSDFENQLRSLRPASLNPGLREKLLEIPEDIPVAEHSLMNRVGSRFSKDSFLSAIGWRKWLTLSLPAIAVVALVFVIQTFEDPIGGGEGLSGNTSIMPPVDHLSESDFPDVLLAQSDYNQQVIVETRHLVPGISMDSTDIPLEMIHTVGEHQVYFPESPEGVRMEVAIPIRQIALRPADIY